MNQILVTKIKKRAKYKYFYSTQFIISIVFFLILIISLSKYFFNLYIKENLSNVLISNYKLLNLYYHPPINKYLETHQNYIFGIIEIPKINIYYPIFSETNEDLLKIAPCKLSGDFSENNSNICIAGHNYNNGMFFSNLFRLEKNDEIFLYDILGKKYIYKVYEFYEVEENNNSTLLNTNNKLKELTLITCTNINSTRLIIKSYLI